jgi:hypothetical protein
VSKRFAALSDLRSRLAFIQKAKGHTSDAGLNVHMGEIVTYPPGDPESAISVVVSPSTPDQSDSRILSKVSVQIQAFVPADAADHLLILEGILGDIKEAVEIEEDASIDRFLGSVVDGKPYGTTPKGVNRGSEIHYPRQEGSTVVGAAVEYILTFEEYWGNP